MRRSVVLVLLWGCQVESAEFRQDFPGEMCDWAETCAMDEGVDPPEFPLPDPPTCAEQLGDAVDALAADPTCEYRPRQAALCLRTLARQACDEKVATYYECKRVFRGDDCELDLSGTWMP